MTPTLLIFGSKSTALEIYEVIESFYLKNYKEIVFVIGNNETMDSRYHFIHDSDVETYVSGNQCTYIISFANIELRAQIETLMSSLKVEPTNVVHPTAIISQTATIGFGNYIAAGSIISTNAKVMNHCMINFDTSIGHDAIIYNHCVFNPGVRISGNVTIKDKVLIGTNSIVFQGKTVEEECVIDALTYIDRDIERRMICSSKQLKIFKRVV